MMISHHPVCCQATHCNTIIAFRLHNTNNIKHKQQTQSVSTKQCSAAMQTVHKALVMKHHDIQIVKHHSAVDKWQSKRNHTHIIHTNDCLTLTLQTHHNAM